MGKSPWYETLAYREKMGLSYTWMTESSPQTLFCIDVSQTIGRMFTGHDKRFPTLTPGLKTMIIDESIGQPRLLTGKEALHIHGFPYKILDHLLAAADAPTDTVMKDLAGNSFVGHCFVAVFISVLAHCPFPAPTSEEPPSAPSILQAVRDAFIM